MAVAVRQLSLDGVYEIVPDRFSDGRGFFSETYNRAGLAVQGIDQEFVQDNFSLSKDQGTLRGLHYQLAPFEQAKIVRVIKGRIFDVAVDIRRGSANFCKWVGLEVSAEEWNQIYIPAGFAHGFVTLEDDCEISYKVSMPYSAAHERSIRYDDPEIGVNWGEFQRAMTLSEKDKLAPLLCEQAELPE